MVEIGLNSKPLVIYSTEDFKVFAKFPEGLFKNRNTVVKIEHDPKYDSFWKAIHKAGGINISNIDALKYKHLDNPPFVPLEDPCFALAFFNDYFKNKLANPSLGWKYLD